MVTGGYQFTSQTEEQRLPEQSDELPPSHAGLAVGELHQQGYLDE